jgi:hypothetical protein
MGSVMHEKEILRALRPARASPLQQFTPVKTTSNWGIANLSGNGTTCLARQPVGNACCKADALTD